MRKKRQKGAAISKNQKKNLSNREHATKFALLPGGGVARKTRSAAKPKAKQNRKEQNEIKSKSKRGEGGTSQKNGKAKNPSPKSCRQIFAAASGALFLLLDSDADADADSHWCCMRIPESSLKNTKIFVLKM